MADPLAIDVNSLPLVPLVNRKAIPNKPGIYFLLDSEKAIQYIGRSCHPRKRWSEHLQQGKLDTSNLAFIKVFLCHYREHHAMEKALISRFNPARNVQHRTDLLALVDVNGEAA